MRKHSFFTSHLSEAQETYFQHLRFTTVLSARIFVVFLLLILHGIFPFWLTRAASDRIKVINKTLQERVKRIEFFHSDYHSSI
ncbi:MAG: hypothetical protein EB060_06385 [Proteobacteria bacterium]|nr:hypothetical protein [Pseudomonadota bacterium]